MSFLWIHEFTGGLDSRRMPETTSGGVLIEATDGHITSGGEFEKRFAFVETYTLPPDTIGMAAGRDSITVFGSNVAPALPAGVAYQRLQNPDDPSDPLVNVPSYDLYAGKLYVAAEFESGDRQHFYDGAAVTDWYDGRARASFTVSGGSVTPAVAAAGSFEITGGTAGAGPDHEITDVKIDGISLFAAPVLFITDNATTAAAVAAEITSTASVPKYNATSLGQTVNITAAATGPAANGKTIVVTVTEDVTTGNVVNMAGGANTVTSVLNMIEVNGVEIIGTPISWATNNNVTAAAITAEIDSFVSTPDYEAFSVNSAVTITATAVGAAANGYAVDFTLADGFAVSPSLLLTMEGGAEAGDVYAPGAFVYTLGSKMYSVAGPNLHFSGVGQPTQWTTDAVGAGFIDMSTQASGFEELVAVGKYQQYLAIFSETAIQIWVVDPDPTLNRQVQVLSNTGTVSARSVTAFSDNDLFYLSASGLRSLRARDASNAASTTDIGVPVDTLIVEQLRTLTTEEQRKIFGLIEPQEGRFWLCMKDRIFVLTYFSGAKVSAWTMYLPGFDIEEAVVFRRKVYLRSGDSIYVFGGLGDTPAYDSDTRAVARLPYLDAETPTKIKTLTGIDAAITGTWELHIGMQPIDTAAMDKIATVSGTTYAIPVIPGQGRATHFSPRFRSAAEAVPAKLGAMILHFAPDADED